MKHIKKHKNQLLLISIGFAFAILIASILASNGRPGMTVLMFVCMGYLLFMLFNNRHIILQYCDEDLKEECDYLRVWK